MRSGISVTPMNPMRESRLYCSAPRIVLPNEKRVLTVIKAMRHTCSFYTIIMMENKATKERSK